MLSALVRPVAGKVVLSGYPSALYDKSLADWNRHASGSRRKRKMTEVLWCNF
jgi:DNA adenine methylase